MLLDELQVDFAMKRGHEMIVDLKSGMKREQLDGIEIQMLQGQRIPKHLPVEWIDIDGEITFRYPLGGKRMLMHRLQTQRMTMFDFYTLLLAVVEALDDCRHYMLRAECFLLHEQYIFIGENWDEAMLAYVPLSGKEVVTSAGEAVLAMAIRWVAAIEEPDGVGLQQVFQHLHAERAAWERLRQTLLALIGASTSGLQRNAVQSTKNKETVEGSHFAASREPKLEKAAFDSPPARANNVFESQPADSPWISASGRDRKEKAEEVDLPFDELPEKRPSSTMGWIVGAGWVLFAAVVWRFIYLGSPSQSKLLLCAGLSLMAGAAALIALRRIRGASESEEEEEDKRWSAEDAFVPNSLVLGADAAMAHPFQRTNAAAAIRVAVPIPLGSEARQAAPVSSPPVKPIVYHSSAANDATVMLGDAAKASQADERQHPWLERQSEGRAERIALERLQFMIGRSSEGTNYTDQASGISRAHLELSGSEGGWSVKDMGSRNGSTLNGSAMIPYKSYALGDSDKLQLAGEQGPIYVFRAG
ncbi:DUF6382 domain-containing protein [Paenibacillus sacheonensis]|uniref:FHA domain-containing protein n=1 Tax=Paenibacillus sacheonensis TaxID=742054 RepID=A0A7X4YS51_9BACL|nr:DUF6382 domain-containing protein [Paenibacillus sacheonensis]MBM7566935.1 hypothetical protein [Paenibacillus sacheonensis]NBC71557.1 FHA domain-containing protein [Paenibacillus sacheonensis]